MNAELQKKTDRAIRFLRSIPNAEDKPVELCYSGGKDSDVILQLAKESGIHFRPIYKCTTIDPKGTIAHAKEMGAEIHKPLKYSFRDLIIERGLPSRIRRFCCSELKEYKILDKQIVGVRRSESTARAKRYKEPTQCRMYGKKEHAELFFPILEWSDNDVQEFIKDRQIKCAPVYYDESGAFHVERRLGCLCCPLQSMKKRIEDFKAHPKMVVFYIHALQIYRANHPTAKAVLHHETACEQFVHDVFYPGSRDWAVHKCGIFAHEGFDYKAFLEDYFKIKL